MLEEIRPRRNGLGADKIRMRVQERLRIFLMVKGLCL